MNEKGNPMIYALLLLNLGVSSATLAALIIGARKMQSEIDETKAKASTSAEKVRDVVNTAFESLKNIDL